MAAGRLLLDTHVFLWWRSEPARMLIGQAQAEGLALVTHDRLLEPYDIEILWA